MPSTYIARQPIFDRRTQLFAYEIQYRPAGVRSHASPTAASRALVSDLLPSSIDGLVGAARALIVLSHDALLDGAFSRLDPAKVILELREPIPHDAATSAAVQALREQGFPLAVGEFAAAGEHHGLLRAAQIVRVDVPRHWPRTLGPLAKRLGRFGVQLLASQLDGIEAAERCRSLGFDLFQGRCFGRPQIVMRRQLPVEMARVARMLNLVFDAGVSDAELADALRSEDALSARLLAAVNAQAIGGLGIDAVEMAIERVGRAPLHRWLLLLFTALAERNAAVERDVVVAALARGRLCELLAIETGHERTARAVFVTGLLSTFEDMLGLATHDLLQYVRVPTDVEAALLHGDGPHMPYLRLAALYGDGDWDEALLLASQLGVDAELPIRYSQAYGWARSVLGHH